MILEESNPSSEELTQKLRVPNCYSALLRSKVPRAILKIVENSPYPIKPWEIAQKSGINPSTVRVYVRRLFQARLIDQPHYGCYQKLKDNITLEGVGLDRLAEAAPRCHKLMFVVRNVKDAVLGRRVLVDNDLFKVLFVGYPNGTVNVFVDCKGSYSFDYAAFRLLVELIKRELGVLDEEAIEVSTYELNVDHRSVQLDGCRSLTLKGFGEAFERFYQKDSHVLRNEVNPQISASPEAMYTLLRGGIVPYNVFQSNFILVKEVERLVDAVKFGNRTQAEFLYAVKALVDRLLRDRELNIQ